MTAAATVADPPAGVCWDCGGPCLTDKGTEHHWRCRTCCARYVEDGAAKAAATDAAELAKRIAKMNSRGGGGAGYGPHRHRGE